MAVLGILLVSGMHFSTARAEGLDLYVVYSGKDKKEKDQLVELLPKDLSIKTFNVGLLVLADYSGKQKAVAKLGRARMVVFLQGAPTEFPKGTQVKADLLIVESVEKTVTSEKWTLHVVSKGTALTDLGDRVRVLEANKAENLEDATRIRSSEVVVVDGKTLELFKAVSTIVEKVLNL